MLSELNYYLDYPIKYLFLNTKGKALIKSTDYLQAYHYYYEIKAAKKIYNHFKKKNFGLGFFASFIPGTKAFTARQEYFLILLEAQKKIERSLNSKKRKFHIWHYSVISPFIFLNNFILKYYTITERALENIQINRGKVRSELIENIPFLADMFSSSTMKKWLKKLAHSLINPIRIISQTLTFFHLILNTFFESSAEIGEKTSIPRQILKGLLALYFIPVRLMVGLIEESINFGLNILKYLLVYPIYFIFKAAVKSFEDYSNENKNLYIPLEEYEEISTIHFYSRTCELFSLGGNWANNIRSKNYILFKLTKQEKKMYELESTYNKKIIESPVYQRLLYIYTVYSSHSLSIRAVDEEIEENRKILKKIYHFYMNPEAQLKGKHSLLFFQQAHIPKEVGHIILEKYIDESLKEEYSETVSLN